MPMLDSGPCQNWPPICDDFPEEPTAQQQLHIDYAIQAATEALWERTQRRFGLCTVTLRPCRRECWSGPMLPRGWYQVGWSWPFPVLHAGKWLNVVCGSCGDNCSCSRLSEVRLPSPVATVSEVKVDGVVLDPSAYRVDDWRLLVRLDGGEWPRCNNLLLDDDQPGTWSVTASYGEMVPTLGSLAVGQLAGAIYKGCEGGKDCPLPAATIRRVVRQGVEKVYFDAASAFKNGAIGLYYPDLFIATYNPGGRRRAKVYDMDKPRGRNAGSIPGPVPALLGFGLGLFGISGFGE
jgi:hypothetical protein